MATSDLNKEYLKYTKQEATKWHFYLGGDPTLRKNVNENAFDWGTDVNLLYKIRENDVNFVTDRVDWKGGIAAVPWSPNSNSDTNTLFFNSTNNIAYLCVSDNLLNRSDSTIRGRRASRYAPSHTTGIKTYEDGYTWYALFIIDPGKIDLITTSKIPVMSIDDFNTDITNTSLVQKYSQTCGSGYTATGTCCLYNKDAYKDGLGITYDKGSLSYVKVTTECYKCSELAQKLNCEYIFKSGITSFSAYPTCTPCDCSIEIIDKIIQIERNLENLNPSGFYRHVYKNYENWSNSSEILSIFINLEGLSDVEKTISIENPTVTFESITGTDALAQIITDNLGNGSYRIKGIQLLTYGKNYKNGDAIPKITGLENSFLNSLIEVNVAPEDFPENPVSMLNNLETCIKVSLTNKMIEDTGTNLRSFSRYGIIKNVKLEEDGTNASEALNKNEYQMLRATTIMTLGVTSTNIAV